MISRTCSCVLAALALLLLGRMPAHSQTQPPVKIAPVQSPEADHASMERLIGAVEAHLREIDRLLDDAGAADRKALAKVGEGGLGELLKRSQDGGRQVVDDIDRILELADHVHPPGT
jgi:hypothetical protein